MLSIDTDRIPIDEIRSRLDALRLNQFSVQCLLLHSENDPNVPLPTLKPIGTTWNGGDFIEGTPSLQLKAVMHHSRF